MSDEEVNKILNGNNLKVPVIVSLLIIGLLVAGVAAVTIINSSNQVPVSPKATPVPVSFVLSVNETSPFVGDGVRVTAAFNQVVSGSVVFKGNGTSLGSPVNVNGDRCTFDFVVSSLDVVVVSAVATLN